MQGFRCFLSGVIILSIIMTGCKVQQSSDQMLIFSATKGFRHKSIPDGIHALKLLALKNKIIPISSEDPALFTHDNLKKYKVIVFLSTSGSFLNDEQKESFRKYIQNGGGFVGIHAATTSFYEWEWYNKMIGAWFINHPPIQPAMLIIKDNNHPSTKHLPERWEHTDEWYNFKSISPDINVLITVDEKSYKGGQNGNFHPVSWYHTFEGGRVFYTAMGHSGETYSDKLFLEHLEGGLKWALRRN